MRAWVGFFWVCVRRAWRGSFSLANAQASLPGLVIILMLTHLLGIKIDFASGLPGDALKVLACFGAVWVLIFFAKLIHAPYGILQEKNAALRDAVARRDETIAGLQGQSTAGLRANIKRDAIKVLVGQGPDFEAVETFPNGVSTRFISIGVRNVGDGYLSECALRIVDASPAREGFKPFSAFSGVTLLPGEPKYARVFRFHEAGELNQPPHNAIMLCEPWTGGFFRRDINIPSFGRDGATIISLKATARGSAPAEAHCRVWIDQDRRLRVEVV